MNECYLCMSVNPYATRRHDPMEGRYNTRSATTNPTGKNRLEAGRKGRERRVRQPIRAVLCLLLREMLASQMNFRYHNGLD